MTQPALDPRMTDRRYHDLVRLAYLVLPCQGNRIYRLAMARRIVDRSVPLTGGRRRNRFARVRTRVLRRAMRPGRLLRVGIGPWLRAVPPRLPDRAVTDLLAGLDPAARAAYVLRHVQQLPRHSVRDQLTAAGVLDPAAAVAAAATVPAPPAPIGELRLGHPVRHRSRTPLAAAVALTIVLVGALIITETGGRPRVVSANRIPGAATPADAWTRGPRTLDAWPARGDLVRDAGFVGRARAAWERRDDAPERPQLLFAGRVAGAGTALLRDGWRVARYTEPQYPEPGDTGSGGSLRILAAGPDASKPMALGAGRYLVAPWTGRVVAVAARRAAVRVQGGVTDPVPDPVPGPRDRCGQGPALELRQPDRGMTVVDLGGLVPAEVSHRTSPGIRLWDRLACTHPRPMSSIVSASAWEFWSGSLPDGGGTGHWVCSRYTFPAGRSESVAALVDGRGAVHIAGDCGRYGNDNAVSGTWWRSPRGRSYYLAAAGPGLAPSVAGTVKVTSANSRSLVAEGRRGGRPARNRVVLTARPVR